MATIKEIADHLGIAISTVSKGLNGASDVSNSMRQLVLDTAVEMGYISKKTKSKKDKKLCIFIINMGYETIDEFGYDIVKGFLSSATRGNWDVSVIKINPTMQLEERYDAYMLKYGYSGAFFLGITLHDEWSKQIIKTTFPTVLLDSYITSNNHVGYVGIDIQEGIALAVAHLVKLGHKKIALLNEAKNSILSMERYHTFIQSMRKHGITPDEKLMEFGHCVPDCVKYFMPKFLDNYITAIICANDIIASSVITEVEKKGLTVPNDISVIGFDDLPIASVIIPPLTTVRQERTDLGKSAFLLLDGLVHNIKIGKILLKAKFIEHKSTKSLDLQ